MKLLAIALLIAFPSIIFAQSNYQQGYVLKNNGDTLKGYIKYPESGYSPVSIEFKVSKADKAVRQFTPLDVKAFQITGFEDYVSYVGTISTNKNVIPNLPYGLDTSTTNGAVFLKPLITGRRITLFYDNEPSKNRFFIAETNGPTDELKYYPYYEGATNGIVEHNIYRGQLLLYNNKFNGGNPQLVSKINDVMFNEADLERIVNLINDDGVDKPNKGINANKKPSGVRLFAGVGANSITTKYTYSSFNPSIPANSVQYSNSVTPKISLGADFFINPSVQRLIFRVELSYSYSNNRFDHSVPAENTTIKSYSLAFTQRTITVTPQVLFNIYNKNKLKIYIDGGVSDNNTSTPNSNPIVSNGFSSDYLYKFTPFWANYSLQAGVVLDKKIEFAFTFTNSAPNLTTFPDAVNIANRSTCFSVKYLFGRN
jgi:hypothetical protein